MNFYKNILNENLDGVAEFICGMVKYDGRIQYEKLHVVEMTKYGPKIRKGKSHPKANNYALGTGGEVVNSFSPLYEIAYIFISLFLAGIGTTILRKNFLSKYKRFNDELLSDIIKTDLLTLSEDEISNSIKHPEIGIICNLDTDVVPLRYFKHTLWRLDESALTKRVAQITKQQYGKGQTSTIPHDYWTAKDQEIADKAIQSTNSLTHAKAVQYYLTVEIFLKELGIDITHIPLYFNFVPKEEILTNGKKSSFLKVLTNLHTPESRNLYRSITRIDKPWFLTKACPRCGQGDKRIVSSKLLADGITVKMLCKPHEFFFRNERGEGIAIKGCGYEYTFKVPKTSQALYNFFKKDDISIHFAARELLTILKDCINNPIGLVVTDLNIVRNSDGELVKDRNKPKGYGDNLDMLISSLALQHFFIHEKILPSTAKRLKKQQLVTSQPLLLFGYEKPTELVDTDIPATHKADKPTYVSDTSALKALAKGISAQKIFKKSVHIHGFSHEELFSLRERSYEYVEEKVSYFKNILYLLEKSRLQTVIDLQYSLATYTKYKASAYLNCAVIDAPLHKEQLELIEKLYINYQRNPAVYFENTTKHAKLKQYLEKRGYTPAFEDTWLFYKSKYIDQSRFQQIKKVRNLQELGIFLDTFHRSPTRDKFTDSALHSEGYLTVLRKAWMKNAKEGSVSYFIAYDKNKPAAVSVLNTHKKIGFISTVRCLPEVQGKDFEKLAILYAVWESQQKGNTTTSIAIESDQRTNKLYQGTGFQSEFTAVGYAKDLHTFSR